MTFLSIVSWIAVAAAVVAIAVPLYFVVRTRLIAAQAERMAPPVGAFLDIDGNRIHYVDRGEGPAIVFIHGLGAQLHHFVGPLFDALPGFRLVALDRPGAGYSVRAAGATGEMKEQALVVRRFIETLGLDKPLVVGHSLGGAVALTLALEHSGIASGLALLSPHTHHSGAIPPGFAPLYIPSRLKRRLVAETIAVPLAQRHAEQTLAFIFAPQLPPDDYMVRGGGWLGLRPGHFYGTATDFVGLGIDYPALTKRFGEIGIPVGILFGTDDNVLDHQANGIDMIGRIPGLELELADGIGHMPQFVAPERTASFIRKIAERAFALQENSDRS